MEYENTERKTIGELVELAQSKGMVVVIIGAGEAGTAVERVLHNDRMMGVHIVNLPDEDRKRVERTHLMDDMKKGSIEELLRERTEKLVMELQNCVVEMPEIELEEKHSSKESKPLPVFKPTKGFKSNFNIRFQGGRRY